MEISFDPTALKTIHADNADAEVKAVKVDRATLNADAKAAIGDGNFAPGRAVTREEMAAHRFAELTLSTEKN